MTSFVDKLKKAQISHDSWVCVGLDPVWERMPQPLRGQKAPFLPFLKAIVDATADLVCAYKPNLGFYLAHGPAGLTVLEQIVAYVPDSIPVILDGKFNDVGHTAQAYAHAAFQTLGADAVTANPYLGRDGMAPFLATPRQAAFLLARTSNPGARDLQDLRLDDPEGDEKRPLYQVVARQASAWNRALPGTCGLVVGATYPEELAQVRALAPELPFLIPGVGAQGGDLAAAVQHGPTREGLGPVINTSRGVLYASSGPEFAQAARQAAERLRGQIEQLEGQYRLSNQAP